MASPQGNPKVEEVAVDGGAKVDLLESAGEFAQKKRLGWFGETIFDSTHFASFCHEKKPGSRGNNMTQISQIAEIWLPEITGIPWHGVFSQKWW